MLTRPAPTAAPPVEVSPTPARPLFQWPRLDVALMIGAFLCGLLLYAWRLNIPSGYVFDEVYHAFTARELVRGNGDAYLWNTTPPPGVAYEWTHPALSKLIIQAGIHLYGSNAVGWRSMSALFGAMGLAVVFTLGRELFNRTVAIFATILLLLDGLWFTQSRIAMNDIFMVVFLLAGFLGYYLYLRGPAHETRRYLWFTGIALGLAFASKWSAGYCFGLIGIFVAVREARIFWQIHAGGSQLRQTDFWNRLGRAGRNRYRRSNSPFRVAAILIGSLILVPVVVYLLAYSQFFAMGHTISQFNELQHQMFYYHSHLKATHKWSSRWWTWPLLLKPVWYWVQYYQTKPAKVANIFGMGNPLVWWAFLPAMAFAFWEWWKGKARSLSVKGLFTMLFDITQPEPDDNRLIGLKLVLIGFFGSWLPWAFSPRIAFMYHFLPSVPFGCLAIGYGLYRLRAPRLAVLGYLLPVLVSFVYFYPMLSGWAITTDYADQHYWIDAWKPR
ncbi:MAG: phospholipid carrier-dependent glycosyltransferase [Dehalococcoidia bacterium]